MTGLLIFVIIVLALVLALHPANRRTTDLTPKPGADMAQDRDRSRVLREIEAVEQREPRVRRVARMLGRAGSAVPMHRSRPIGARRVPRTQV